MRKLALFALTILATAALCASAAAKEGGVELSTTPYGSEPGEPWTGTMTLFGGTNAQVRAARPTITIRNLATGEENVFTATRGAQPRAFDFAVTFPEAGRYSVTVEDGLTGRSYPFPTVAIQPTSAQPTGSAPGTQSPVAAMSSNGDGGFPLWPVVGGLAGFLLLLGGGTAHLLRRRQLGLSH